MRAWFTAQKPSKGCPKPVVMDCVSELASTALSGGIFLSVSVLEKLSLLAVYIKESNVHCKQ